MYGRRRGAPVLVRAGAKEETVGDDVTGDEVPIYLRIYPDDVQREVMRWRRREEERREAQSRADDGWLEDGGGI